MPRLVFTDEILTAIPSLVAQNCTAEEIARQFDCNVNSLKVACSKRKISLRTPDWKVRRKQKFMQTIAQRPSKPRRPPRLKIGRPVVQPKPTPLTMQSSLPLSRTAMSLLRQRAEAIGVTEAQLATSLLEVIAKDNLYDAVLDTKAA